MIYSNEKSISVSSRLEKLNSTNQKKSDCHKLFYFEKEGRFLNTVIF